MSEYRYTCADCQKSSDEHSEFYYAHDYLNEKSRYFCNECAIRRWDCPIHFVFHDLVPQEVKDRFLTVEMLRRLNKWFKHSTGYFPVHVFSRRQAETVEWMRFWSTRGLKPDKPYSYRGYCRYDRIVLLFDETETLDSFEWILYHELGHHACNKNEMFDDAVAEENKIEGRTTYEWEDDVGHEADSEERLVNRIATAYMGGREYARPWWRPRVNAKLKGEPMPDLVIKATYESVLKIENATVVEGDTH